MQKINFENYPSTTTPIDADNLNDLQDNVEEAVDLINTYSTTETVVGKWIDDKPIYRKVYNVGNLPNNTEKKVASGLTNVNIIKIYGYATESIGTFIPLPFTTPAAIANCVSLLYNSTNEIVINALVDRSQFNGYVILEYTKTNDIVEE